MELEHLIRLKSPLSVQLEVTPECNNLCKHCYNSWRPNACSTECLKQDKENDKYLEKIVTSLINSEIFNVVLTGGEPLLNKGMLRKIIPRFVENNVGVNMNSNLTFLDKRYARELKEMGLNSVLTSVMHFKGEIHDKISQNKGSYERALEGIKNARQAELKVTVNMVTTQETVEDVYRTGRYLYENFDINGFCATRVNASPGSQEIGVMPISKKGLKLMLDQLIQLKEEINIRVDSLCPIPHCFDEDWEKYSMFYNRYCNAGRTFVSVSSKGEVYACQHTPLHYGNILNEDFGEIFKKMQDWKQNKYLPKKCSNCKEVEYCGGGCREFALNKNGSRDSVDPYVGAHIPKRNVVRKETITENGTYHFNDNLKCREESFGATIVKEKNVTFLTDLGYEFCKRFYSKDFKLKDAEKDMNLPTENVKAFLEHLYYKLMIIDVRR